jgi:hypothetical protein
MIAFVTDILAHNWRRVVLRNLVQRLMTKLTICSCGIISLGGGSFNNLGQELSIV